MRTLLFMGLLVATSLTEVLAQTPVTQNVYRLPYANGTVVFVSNSHDQHANRLDLRASNGAANIVAAAAGTVRIVVDNHHTACIRPRLADFKPPNAMSDYDLSGNNLISRAEMATALSAEGADWLEKTAINACENYSGPAGKENCCMQSYERVSGASCPSGNNTSCLTGFPADGPNNYVWIEHENGEWSKYSHFGLNAVEVSVGDQVSAGDVLGLEGDVGFVTGPHLHFEVAAIDNISDIGAGGYVLDVDSTMSVNVRHRVPVFCQLGVLVDNDLITSVPCDDQCGHANRQLGGVIGNDSARMEQVSNELLVLSTVKSGSGFSTRAGKRVVLEPGFVAERGAFFAATISGCDRPGGVGE